MWRNSIPSRSTMPRKSSWLEITSGMSMCSSPERQRQSRSARQWPSRLTRMATRGCCASSRIVHSARSSSPSGANALRSASAPSRSVPESMARRAKNQETIGSVNWWTSRRLPPRSATKFVSRASRPTRSGQASLSRVADKRRNGAARERALQLRVAHGYVLFLTEQDYRSSTQHRR